MNIQIISSTIIICLTIFWLSWNLQNTWISIKNTWTVSGQVQNSLTVSWEWKAMANPDIVRIRAWISELAKTTKEAQINANIKLNKILEALKAYDIPDSDIQTNNLSINPEHEWTKENGRQLIWQRVRQNLNIKITEIDKDKDRVSSIIDTLWEINWLELNSINFDIENKKGLFTKAREKAFEKAKQKAIELAKLWGLKLLKPITISESRVNYNPPMFSNVARMDMAESSSAWWGSSIPAWELEVIANINVVFWIE